MIFVKTSLTFVYLVLSFDSLIGLGKNIQNFKFWKAGKRLFTLTLKHLSKIFIKNILLLFDRSVFIPFAELHEGSAE